MFSKKICLVYIIIIMFSLINKTIAQYDKLFFDLNIKDIQGKMINFSKYKDKTILLVNVASKCGFTKQYSGLQALYEKYKDKGLVIIGIPSNQFGGQEPGSNKEIKNFCEINFNITFPITDKVDVKGKNAHPIYLWAKENYGNSTVPKWNFHKILINKNGKIQNTYNSFIKPMSKKIIKEIELIL
jgi:glutathione peroxidase